MIITFDPAIFISRDAATQECLAEILIEISRKQYHLFSLEGLSGVFLDGKMNFIFEMNPIVENYFSKHNLKIFKEYITRISVSGGVYITQLHKHYLKKLKIGNGTNNIRPYFALKILKERSKVIIENGINDWKFLKGVCDKYTNHKVRKTIYSFIQQAIKDDFLEADHSGGHGEIVKIVEKWKSSDRYKDIEKYKLMALFDSDRTSQTDFITHQDKIAYFKSKNKHSITNLDYECDEANDVIIWHILYKRKLENYVPLSQLYQIAKYIVPDQKVLLDTKSVDELDFIEYGNPSPKFDIGISNSNIKEELPKIFQQNFSYQELEKRCEHHKIDHTLPNGQIEQITEMEEILLKMAKII